MYIERNGELTAGKKSKLLNQARDRVSKGAEEREIERHTHLINTKM